MPDWATRNEQATSAFDVLLSRRCQTPELRDAVDPEPTIGMIFWAPLAPSQRGAHSRLSW
jgi:hypothetical protein